MQAKSSFASLHANARQWQVQCILSSNLDSSRSLEATPFLLPVITLAPSVARPVSWNTSNLDSAIGVKTVDFIVSALADLELVRRFLVDRNCVVALLLSGSAYLIKVTSCSFLAMLQTSSQRRAKQLAHFTFFEGHILNYLSKSEEHFACSTCWSMVKEFNLMPTELYHS